MPTHTRPRTETGPSASAAPHAVVELSDLHKRFRSRTVVDGVSLSVPPGSVTGLVGPNGAGKTTLMGVLLGLIRPTSGTGTVFGVPLADRRGYLGRVGALIESPAFHPGVSGVDNLRSVAALGGHSARGIDDLLDLVGLTDRGRDPFGRYSLGMKQRLGIAAALLGDPELVILDEPTNGLDPVGIHDVRTVVGALAERGRTVIVSSHLLGEVEQVCDRLVILDGGKVRHQGTLRDFTVGDTRLTVRPADREHLRPLADIAASYEYDVTDDGHMLAISLDPAADPHRVAADLNRRAHAAGVTLVELHVRHRDLHQRYLDLVGGR